MEKISIIIENLYFSVYPTCKRQLAYAIFNVRSFRAEKGRVFMKKQYFSVQEDGFYGCYYPVPSGSKCALIGMLGDAVDDYLAMSFVKWLLPQGCNVMAMAPAKKDYGHHNLPLERFEHAIHWLKSQGIERIAIAGGSTTGMLALIAASYYADISLTVAFSPSDFVMEGYYQGKKDGAKEWPGQGESTVSYQGKPVPYLPFAYRHPEYWQQIQAESKQTKNMIASRALFDESERRHPLQEQERIKVERIQGKIVFIGAEDDCLWDTCRYIRRMQERLAQYQAPSTAEYLLYEHGTHFIFPDSMLTKALPLLSGFFVGRCFQAARDYPKECKATRIDIDRRLRKILADWINA